MKHHSIPGTLLVTFVVLFSVNPVAIKIHSPSICNEFSKEEILSDSLDVVVYACNAKQIRMFWKDSNGIPYKGFGQLFVSNEDLIYATNGGPFDLSLQSRPLGFYVENCRTLSPINRQPNKENKMRLQGVFYVTRDGLAKISTTKDFNDNSCTYATQGGPILIKDGKLQPNLADTTQNVRNGIGLTPENRVVIVADKNRRTLNEFAKLFMERNCVAAMLLDEGISNALPRQKLMFDGCACYGPFIGVVKEYRRTEEDFVYVKDCQTWLYKDFVKRFGVKPHDSLLLKYRPNFRDSCAKLSY